MPREEECIATLRELRWKDGVRCTKCGSSNVKKDGVRGLYQMYECKDCRSYFNDRTGTVFQDTKIPLRKWFLMAFLMQFNISILEVSKTVGVPYRNAFYIARKIRNGMYVNQILEKLKGRNRGEGRALHHCGREREKRASRNPRRTALKARGRGTYQRDKPPIVGMVSRETKQVRVAPSSGVTGREIINRAVKNIDPDTTIYHDDYRAYGILDGCFRHESVIHSAGEYARGDIHTNTIEGEFSVLRLWLQTFRGMSKEYAYLCCAHYQLLRSNRGMERVDRALSMFCLASTVDAHQGSELEFRNEPALLPVAASD